MSSTTSHVGDNHASSIGRVVGVWLSAHGEEGFEASLAVQPIWLEVVRWELPSVMGGLGLIGTVAGKSSKIEAWSGTIQGRVGTVG